MFDTKEDKKNRPQSSVVSNKRLDKNIKNDYGHSSDINAKEDGSNQEVVFTDTTLLDVAQQSFNERSRKQPAYKHSDVIDQESPSKEMIDMLQQ